MFMQVFHKRTKLYTSWKSDLKRLNTSESVVKLVKIIVTVVFLEQG